MPNIPAKWRRWIYGVSIATIPVLVTFGWLDNAKAPTIIGLLNAMFIGGLAMYNVPKSDDGN